MPPGQALGSTAGDRPSAQPVAQSFIDPADPRQLASLLARHRLRPRRRLGQNFLVDRQLRDELAAASGVVATDSVLEVGAGLGALTLGLAARCGELIAVELDERLAQVLRGVVKQIPNVRVMEADILSLDVQALFPGGGHVVAGNVPYYLTGALLRKLLEPVPRPRRLALVVQKEVAERWIGEAGWSLATVVVHAFSTPRIALELPAAAFVPAPQVSSSLVLLDVLPQPALKTLDVSTFFRFVESVFQFRRKQLQSSLARIAKLTSGATAERLRAVGVEPRLRPEELELEQWEALFVEFAARK